jgi:DNA-binding transcriptional MerR regulator
MHAAAETRDEGDAVYNIGTAARKSGLSVTTIRTWEDRYGAVVPVRDASGRRLYSNQQIVQLAWLRQQIDAGLRASEAHRLLISGDIDEPASPTMVDHGSAWVTFLAWTEGEEPWIASVLGDLGRGLGSGATALAAVVSNPICGPVLTVTTVDPGSRDPIDDLAVLVMDRVEGLVEEVAGGDSFAADGTAFGVDGTEVVVTPIRLGGELAGVLVATGTAVDDPTVLMQRAAKVIESRIEADRARSAFSSLLD